MGYITEERIMKEKKKEKEFTTTHYPAIESYFRMIRTICLFFFFFFDHNHHNHNNDTNSRVYPNNNLVLLRGSFITIYIYIYNRITL